MDKFVVKRARTHPSPPDSPSLRPTNLASTRDDSDDNRLIRRSFQGTTTVGASSLINVFLDFTQIEG